MVVNLTVDRGNGQGLKVVKGLAANLGIGCQMDTEDGCLRTLYSDLSGKAWLV